MRVFMPQWHPGVLEFWRSGALQINELQISGIVLNVQTPAPHWFPFRLQNRHRGEDFSSFSAWQRHTWTLQLAHSVGGIGKN